MTFSIIAFDIKHRLNPSILLPTHVPRREWIDCGSDIKTSKAYERNLTKIIDISHRKKEPLLMMTFAYYLPNHHDSEYYENNSCNDISRKCAVEIWGEPENVAKGINIHNQVIKDVVTKNNIKLFLDQNNLMPKSELYFNDICHLRTKGAQKFVDNILKVLTGQ